MRILFMGTPDFAARSLEKLIECNYSICGVFTQPDKPAGRGNKLQASPVKTLALINNIPVYQPDRIRNEETLELIKSLNPDIIVVVAYGKIIPDSIIALPEYGIINIHGSLLPKYRGAAPIQWAVLNGEKTTGVTSMYIAHDMDAGDIIYKTDTDIGMYETSGELYDRLSIMGADLLIKTLKDIENGTAPRIPQIHEEATFTTQLDKSLSPIDFTKSAAEVIHWINGLNPWPVATMVISENTYKVYKAEYTDIVSQHNPGELIGADKKGIEICCGDGRHILITEMQAPGKKRMKVSDFLCGNKII